MRINFSIDEIEHKPPPGRLSVIGRLSNYLQVMDSRVTSSTYLHRLPGGSGVCHDDRLRGVRVPLLELVCAGVG